MTLIRPSLRIITSTAFVLCLAASPIQAQTTQALPPDAPTSSSDNYQMTIQASPSAQTTATDISQVLESSSDQVASSQRSQLYLWGLGLSLVAIMALGLALFTVKKRRSNP